MLLSNVGPACAKRRYGYREAATLVAAVPTRMTWIRARLPTTRGENEPLSVRVNGSYPRTVDPLFSALSDSARGAGGRYRSWNGRAPMTQADERKRE